MNKVEQNGKSLESWIWDAACSIRGAKDAPKFKEFILPLIFAKRLCDVFDDEINRIAQEASLFGNGFNDFLFGKSHWMTSEMVPAKAPINCLTYPKSGQTKQCHPHTQTPNTP